jgi:hypothetical protein
MLNGASSSNGVNFSESEQKAISTMAMLFLKKLEKEFSEEKNAENQQAILQYATLITKIAFEAFAMKKKHAELTNHQIALKLFSQMMKEDSTFPFQSTRVEKVVNLVINNFQDPEKLTKLGVEQVKDLFKAEFSSKVETSVKPEAEVEVELEVEAEAEAETEVKVEVEPIFEIKPAPAVAQPAPAVAKPAPAAAKPAPAAAAQPVPAPDAKRDSIASLRTAALTIGSAALVGGALWMFSMKRDSEAMTVATEVLQALLEACRDNGNSFRP